jgi:ACS family D-galactonate transporter-like MFS transporter
VGRSASEEAGALNRRRWIIVGLLFVASLINYLDRSTLSLALPLISRDLGLGPASKGMLLSAFFWSYAFMQVPIGVCADRYNLKWLYAGSFALWSISCGLAGVAWSLGSLIVFRVLLGIGESIYLPGGSKIVSVFFSREERGMPSGIFDFGTRIGLALGGVVLPFLIVRHGWREMFMFVGFAALLWLIPWFWVFPSGATAPKEGTSRRKSPAPARPFPRSLLPFTIHRDLIGICLGFFCFDYYWYLLLTWLPDYLVEVRHFSVVKAGLLASLPYLVFGVAEPIGGWIADYMIQRGGNETRTRKGIVTVAFLMGLCLIPAAYVPSPTAAIALIVGASLVGLGTANLLVILQVCAPSDEIGVWTGVENFFGNIGGILAPLLTGFLIARTGSYSSGFVLAAVVLITGLLAYWFIVGDLNSRAEQSR